MLASVSISLDPRAAVPAAPGRAAWLTQFGPVTSSSTVVVVTLPVETWEGRGVELTPEGAVTLSLAQKDALVAAVLLFITSTGAIPATLPQDRAITALGG